MPNMLLCCKIQYILCCYATQSGLHLARVGEEASKCGLVPPATIGGQFNHTRHYYDITMTILLQMCSCHSWRTIGPQATMPQATFLHSCTVAHLSSGADLCFIHMKAQSCGRMQMCEWMDLKANQATIGRQNPPPWPDHLSITLAKIPLHGFEGQSDDNGRDEQAATSHSLPPPLLTSLITVPNFQMNSFYILSAITTVQGHI